MPESLKIREDRPIVSEMHAELEALRLRSAALTSPSQTDPKAMQDDRNFQVWPMVAATLGTVAAILGGYEFGLSEKLEHLGVWEKIA